MIPRLLELPMDHSFFLFGPRGSGKSTLICGHFDSQNSLIINLLKTEEERKFSSTPEELEQIVKTLDTKTKYVVIDEIQKIPKLLDVVHYLIESTDKIFILTGSSARKLKRGAANLLAGRAFVCNLHPFSYLELIDQGINTKNLSLEHILNWGLLPKIYQLQADKSKSQYLQSYANTYLKEEIWAEQFIKELDPFRYFLEVAAQMNGEIISFSKIARDVGVSDITVNRYYSILEDTLIGFFLPAFKHSFRKRLNTKSKFYFFDTGVTRALQRTLSNNVQKGSYVYGKLFEHFIILECIKLASYYKEEYRFSYLRTKDAAEIDLVIERPGLPILFIEIKSSDHVRQESLSSFIKLVKDFGECEAICLSQDPYEKLINENIRVIPWQIGIKRFFT